MIKGGPLVEGWVCSLFLGQIFQNDHADKPADSCAFCLRKYFQLLEYIWRKKDIDPF